MAVIFKQVGETAIFSADAEVRTNDGILEVSIVETQRIPTGKLNGVLQISLNGRPLLISSSSVWPLSKGGGIRKQFQVYDSNKLDELGVALVRVFEKLARELKRFESNGPIPQRLPCFIRIPLCRLAYSQYIVACRLRGRPAQDCLREAEAIYNNCKGRC